MQKLTRALKSPSVLLIETNSLRPALQIHYRHSSPLRERGRKREREGGREREREGDGGVYKVSKTSE